MSTTALSSDTIIPIPATPSTKGERADARRVAMLAEARDAGRQAATHTKALHAGHIPALDGIRGVAVLLVLLCHGTMIHPDGAIGQLFLAGARLTWSGVDLFFVLSGFLITGILFDSKGERGFFRNFYARRTVRIFPLYYAFLVLTLLLFPAIPALASLFGETPASKSFYWLYLSNFYQPFAPTHHMVHVSWSLAIEEQFYLFWPLVVFVCTRKTLLRACGAMFLGSLMMRVALLVSGIDWHIAWVAANDLTFCRLDGLAAGAWIALLIRGDGAWAIASLVRYARVIVPAAMTAMACVVVGSYALGWRGGVGQSPAYVVAGYSIFALLYASVLILVVSSHQQGLVQRIFSGKFLTTFGKYSYACYLLNTPVNIVLARFLFNPDRPGASNATLFAGQAAYYVVSCAATLLVAWVSWNVLEKHCLKLKKYFPTGPAPAPVAFETLPIDRAPETPRPPIAKAA